MKFRRKTEIDTSRVSAVGHYKLYMPHDFMRSRNVIVYGRGFTRVGAKTTLSGVIRQNTAKKTRTPEHPYRLFRVDCSTGTAVSALGRF